MLFQIFYRCAVKYFFLLLTPSVSNYEHNGISPMATVHAEFLLPYQKQKQSLNLNEA